MGETYRKQGQSPLSLEAHLHACKTDKDSKARIVELLENNQYAVTEEGKILNKDSLLLLFNEKRRAKVNKMLADCGLRAKMQHVVIFRNLVFNSGKATLKQKSNQQLNQIAADLKFVKPTWIKIDGHSDNQRWRGKSMKQSQQLNLELSQQRAYTVKKGLINQNIEQNRIQAKGHGSKHPLVPGNSKTAQAKNRRVEIAVK
ncbi:OmpA family protein [Candidatus Halobeggiatoa sp. HSG11]|nr:OmpA family protein [Candidatus Halobeggiatoa sp. HSG11]